MSLYSILRTGVSGLNAQSNKLGTIADNIANTGTTGYKRASTEFSSLIIEAGNNKYTSGVVATDIRYDISKQGALTFTTSQTDLAIQGEGFFVVQDPNGNMKLSRSGSFEVDGATGNLVNAGGFTLMGYNTFNGQPPVELNGFAGLVPIDTSIMNMDATASRNGVFTANLDSNAPVVAAAERPSANPDVAGAGDPLAFSAVSSVIAFDELGNEVVLDVYFTNTGPGTYEMTVFNQADANADPNTSFPYGAGPLQSVGLTFDAEGRLNAVAPPPTGNNPLAIDVPMTLPVGPGTQIVNIDLSATTQLAADYTPLDVQIDGNAPAIVDEIRVTEDGSVFAEYENGSRAEFFRIPLADVPSPDKLKPTAGTVFDTTLESGDVLISWPTEGGNGSVISGALEQSNVDIADELTEMILAQRDYTANSKSFQTGNELLEVLINLKR